MKRIVIKYFVSETNYDNTFCYHNIKITAIMKVNINQISSIYPTTLFLFICYIFFGNIIYSTKIATKSKHKKCLTNGGTMEHNINSMKL